MHPRARTFRDLIVWHRAKKLVVAIYRITSKLPPDERFGLTTQMRRAVVSLPANIAEGWARGSPAEFRRGCAIALGSLHELETHVDLAEELGFILANDGKGIRAEMDEIGRMLTALKRKLAARSSVAPGS